MMGTKYFVPCLNVILIWHHALNTQERRQVPPGLAAELSPQRKLAVRINMTDYFVVLMNEIESYTLKMRVRKEIGMRCLLYFRNYHRHVNENLEQMPSRGFRIITRKSPGMFNELEILLKILSETDKRMQNREVWAGKRRKVLTGQCHMLLIPQHKKLRRKLHFKQYISIKK